MKILLFLAKGFETMEASPFIDVFGWSRNDLNEDIEIVTCGFTKEVISTFNVPVKVDILIDEVKVEEYVALAIPGGFQEYGFYEEAFDERFLSIIREFNNHGKYIASICVAALPIGKSGVLKDRKGTTYHLKDGSRQKQLAEFGVNVINEPIVVDNNIITSWCPSTAAGVAFKLFELLTSIEKANKLRELMGY